jgi:TonB family protein
MKNLLVIFVLLMAAHISRGQEINDTVMLSGHVKVIYETKADKYPEPSFDFGKFMAKNIRYPDDARDNGVSGKVLVRITIDETGKVVNPEIVSSPDASLSEEVIRLAGIMPEWKPGTKDGKGISISLKLPVAFNLE